jgi:predicted TIM-barrel fold metal-dependent hydrolase
MTGEARWRQDWGRPVREPAIDPARPLIDPHHHLWPERAAGTTPAGPYLARDLADDLASGHRVVATVAVEAGASYWQGGAPELASVGETEFLAAQAAALAAMPGAPRLGGIVAHVDLRLGDRVKPVLEAHAEAAGGLLRGVRQMAAFAADGPQYSPLPNLYADQAFRQGVRALGAAGLTFDAWHFHLQQGDFAELARACPETTFVLDHYGTPLGVGAYAGRGAEVMADWRRSLPALAALPNVYVKASGFCMSMTGSRWREHPDPPTSAQLAAEAQPWFDALIAHFGPGRCMFASNFPVDKTGVAYRVLWNAYKTLAAGFSEAEIDALCRGTAAKVYRIDEGAGV